ncbi:MAG: 50S ribosomal protein L9 [Simkaniaceae bacterium]|nr:50S ribosomal protein L9 [Simkaniaceae bacterium]
MQHQVLLLEDLPSGARKGEIIKVKAGYARNFLLPKKKATYVDKRTVRMQERLKAEREKQAAEDLKQSKKMADDLEGKVLSHVAKVDPDGHMYGSVSAGDLVDMLSGEGFIIERRFVRIGGPIRTLGKHTIPLVLKEGVTAEFTLEVKPDKVIKPKKEEKKPVEEEAAPEEEKPAEE